MSTSLNGTTGRLPAPVGRPEASNGVEGGGAASAVLLVILAIASLFLMQGDLNQRILLTLCVATTLYALMSFAPTVGAIATICFLATLGFLKRAMIPAFGYQTNDPLMLVDAVIITIPFVQRLLRREIPFNTFISKLVLVLLVVMVLEVLNPLQGGVAVGIAGAMYYIVPLLWFYFGRFNGSPAMFRAVLNGTLFIAVVTGLYGQYQQFFGFTDFEKLWMHYTGWVLGIGAAQKVFSTFPSTAEYGEFLGIGVVLCFGGILRRRMISIPFFIAFFAMMFFSGNRTIVFTSLAGCAVMWAIQGREAKVWLPRLIGAGVFAVLALTLGARSINVSSIGSGAAHDLVEHQVQGLSDPLSKSSSGSGHLSLIGGGLVFSLTHPLGSGLGATTLGMKLAGDSPVDAISTENDFSNLYVSLGFFGGSLYLVLMFAIARSLFRNWLRYRTPESLSMIGILVCQLGLWIMGSHYAEAAIIWVCIGCLDRMDNVERLKKLDDKSNEEPVNTRKPSVTVLPRVTV